jgi:hypothetical protein
MGLLPEDLFQENAGRIIRQEKFTQELFSGVDFFYLEDFNSTKYR